MSIPRVRIENWKFFRFAGERRMTGQVYGHPQFRDGETVYTSIVRYRRGNTVRTFNTLYSLGVPANAS